jgi:YidC/Oxa1 family membrane protein insertase
MFSFIWHTFFFDPVYNTLVYTIAMVRGGDVGIAIIITILLVKVLLLPLSLKAARTQRIMREIEPKLREIKEQHKDNKEQYARATMAVYKDAGLNPFAAIFLVFIQIPIVIALYFSVYSGGGVPLPAINTDLLYSFVSAPSLVSMNFLGLIDITGTSLLLAFAAGVTQFFQVKLAMPTLPPRDPNAPPNFKDDFARTMQMQMRYVMPVLIFFVAYTISAAIALYFFVSNLVSIAQELVVKSKR